MPCPNKLSYKMPNFADPPQVPSLRNDKPRGSPPYRRLAFTGLTQLWRALCATALTLAKQDCFFVGLGAYALLREQLSPCLISGSQAPLRCRNKLCRSSLLRTTSQNTKLRYAVSRFLVSSVRQAPRRTIRFKAGLRWAYAFQKTFFAPRGPAL